MRFIPRTTPGLRTLGLSTLRRSGKIPTHTTTSITQHTRAATTSVHSLKVDVSSCSVCQGIRPVCAWVRWYVYACVYTMRSCLVDTGMRVNAWCLLFAITLLTDVAVSVCRSVRAVNSVAMWSVYMYRCTHSYRHRHTKIDSQTERGTCTNARIRTSTATHQPTHPPIHPPPDTYHTYTHPLGLHIYSPFVFILLPLHTHTHPHAHTHTPSHD